MSGERLPPHTAAPEHHIFDDVCGLSRAHSTPPSASDMGEWTPHELWFNSYQNLLLQERAGAAPLLEPPQANAEAVGQERSHSSNASAAGTSGDASGEGSKQTHGFFSRTKEKVKRWKNRTFAQQQANKAAQKRYREKRKGEVTQLQVQADALAAQVRALEGLGQENSRLAASNEAIVKQLSSATSSGSGREGGPSSNNGNESEWRSFNDKFLGQVEDLRRYLEQCGVAASPTDVGTPPEVLQEIIRRTGDAMSSCMQALNLGGLKLQALLDAVETRQAYRSSDGGDHPSITAASKVNLSREQVARGLQYRQHVLGTLDRIYLEREMLNGSVRACLIDGQPGLGGQLKALKANLAAEQRAISEQHYLVFRMLLSHTQGAWVLCHSYPLHCCCVAFLKGLEDVQ